MSLIHNEKTKLTAACLNTLATTTIAAGGITPLAAIAYGLTIAHRDAWLLALVSVIWILAGIGLHMVARKVLGRLIP